MFRLSTFLVRVKTYKGCFPPGGILRGKEFFFVLFQLVLPENSQTKISSARRGKFRREENSLKSVCGIEQET